ncbi:SRPBCC domain-containing protein [Ruania suaedae]|uniref:SRPBCC family protein n=1 Tax=Ruania suaedae TaxID=2897774 RepID=UPI001E4061A6|nr:SRPBCC domain-containing protein [Ruania suaedae]UFU01947.1 SRPBCC domain-containing protein [Ruania suaedae]
MTPTTITVSRLVSADPEQAFAAWVEPAQMAQWWWPQWPDTEYELDARPGGEYRIVSAAAGVGVTGRFTVVDPPLRLAMTWLWISDDEAPGEGATDTVEVSFVPTEGGTVVTVLHTSTTHVADGGAEQGWNDVLDRLPGRRQR